MTINNPGGGTVRTVRLNSGYGPTAIGILLGAGILLVIAGASLLNELREGSQGFSPSLFLVCFMAGAFVSLFALGAWIQSPVTLDLERRTVTRGRVSIPFSGVQEFTFYATFRGFAWKFSAPATAAWPRLRARATLESTFRTSVNAEQWSALGELIAGSSVQAVLFRSTGEQFRKASRPFSKDDTIRLIELQRLARLQTRRFSPDTPICNAIRGY